MLHLVAQQAFGDELNLYSGRAAVEKARIFAKIEEVMGVTE